MFETKKDYNETEMRTLIELLYGSIAIKELWAVKFSSGLTATAKGSIAIMNSNGDRGSPYLHTRLMLEINVIKFFKYNF